MIAMEMVTAKPVNVNAWPIMSIHKIVPIMDVSTYTVNLCTSFFAQIILLFDTKVKTQNAKKRAKNANEYFL